MKLLNQAPNWDKLRRICSKFSSTVEDNAFADDGYVKLFMDMLLEGLCLMADAHRALHNPQVKTGGQEYHYLKRWFDEWSCCVSVTFDSEEIRMMCGVWGDALLSRIKEMAYEQ